MVDDKSTDETVPLMQKLAGIHKEIRLFYHTHNKGGGAARNTGIKFSEGNLIYCLDSDNLLYPDTMQLMINQVITQDCDGSVIYERRYFKEKDFCDYQSHFNHHLDKPITFENLFDYTDVLLDNFLFKKEAYNKTLGYPEKHGFDTQCFEVRFLAAGNIAYVCPNTIFLHRQSLSSKGYFHRVYEEGLFSLNFYLIFEEVLYLFSKKTIHSILMFDVFTKNKLGENNLKSFLTNQYKHIGTKIFSENYKSFLVQDGGRLYNLRRSTSEEVIDTFISAVFLFYEKRFKESLRLYTILSKKCPDSKIVKYNIARCELAIMGTTTESSIESGAIKKSGLKPIPRKLVLNAHWIHLLLVRIKKYFT